MTVLLWTTWALVLWVIAWALGVKGFDGMMAVILIVLLATGWSMLKPFLPGYRSDPEQPGSGRSWIPR